MTEIHDADGREPGPSRSQLKREEDERQKIAAGLVELSPGQIQQLPLDAETRAAILAAAAPRHKTPRRRGRLHVAALLRDVPLEDLRAAVARIQSGESPRADLRGALVDRWIERLLEEERETVAALFEFAPDLDVGRLRQLVRNLRNAAAPGGEKARRALRQYLTELRPGPDLPETARSVQVQADDGGPSRL